MNKTRETGKRLRKGRRSIFGVVVAFMVMSVFFLVACDNNAMDTDMTEAATVESISKAVMSENTQQGEGRNISRRTEERSFSREDFVRWAEDRGYSREDFIRWAGERGYSRENLSQRHVWRENCQAEGRTFQAGECRHQRFDKDNKGEGHFERFFL